MAGYLAKFATNTEGMSYNALLYCKTNIGGYFFDGFLKVNHSVELEITSNPVETGASVVDHAYVKPATLSMEVMMSDVHESLVPGQFLNRWSRSVSAWELLRKLQSDRIPLSVLTRLWQYDNMLIKKISAEDDASTYSALKATVELQEIPVARVKKVKISAAPQSTVSTEMGKLEAFNTDKSILKTFSDLFSMWMGG